MKYVKLAYYNGFVYPWCISRFVSIPVCSECFTGLIPQSPVALAIIVLSRPVLTRITSNFSRRIKNTREKSRVNQNDVVSWLFLFGCKCFFINVHILQIKLIVQELIMTIILYLISLNDEVTSCQRVLG